MQPYPTNSKGGSTLVVTPTKLVVDLAPQAFKGYVGMVGSKMDTSSRASAKVKQSYQGKIVCIRQLRERLRKFGPTLRQKIKTVWAKDQNPGRVGNGVKVEVGLQAVAEVAVNQAG